MDERIRQGAYDQGDSHKYDDAQGCFTHEIYSIWWLLEVSELLTFGNYFKSS